MRPRRRPFLLYAIASAALSAGVSISTAMGRAEVSPAVAPAAAPAAAPSGESSGAPTAPPAAAPAGPAGSAAGDADDAAPAAREDPGEPDETGETDETAEAIERAKALLAWLSDAADQEQDRLDDTVAELSALVERLDPPRDAASRTIVHRTHATLATVVDDPEAQRRHSIRAVATLRSLREGARLATSLERHGDLDGAVGAATWLVERLIGSDPPDRRSIPYLVYLSSLERARGNSSGAFAWLERADTVLEALDATPEQRCSVEAERSLAALRLGLPDLAAEALAAEARWLDELDDAALQAELPGHRIRSLDLRLTTDRFEAAIRDANAALADPMIAVARDRASILLRRGIAESHVTGADAAASFAAVLDLAARNAGAAATVRPRASDVLAAATRLAAWHLDAGALEPARDMLQRARTLAEDKPADPAEEALLVAIEIRALLAAEAETESAAESDVEALRDARTVALAALDRVLDDASAGPIQASGIGALRSGRVRRLIGAIIEIELAIEPDGAAERCLDHLARCRAVSTLARTLRVGTWTAGEAGRALRDPGVVSADEVLCSWFVTPDRSYVIHGTANGLQLARGPARSELERVRRAFVDAVTSPPTSMTPDAARARRVALEPTGAALADILLPTAVRDALAAPGTGLVVIGLDTLGYVPFEALRVGDAWLGLQTPVRYVPSLPVAVALASGHDGAFAAAGTLVAAPTHGPAVRSRFPTLDTLPLSEREAARVASAWDSTVVLVADAATPTAARTAAAETERASGWIQFLVHGARAARAGVTSAMVLAADPPDASDAPDAPDESTPDDGLVTAVRLEQWSLPPLAILTVCSSGRGVQRWGDAGASDLSGVAFRAGARSVVLPRGELELRSTVALTRAMHDGLARGLRPAVALQQARGRIARDEEFEDPFAFALLHVHGRPLAADVGSAAVAGASDRDAGSGASRLAAQALALAVVGIAGVVIAAVVLRSRRPGG